MKSIIGLILTMALLLAASIDFEPKTPEPPVEYDMILDVEIEPPQPTVARSAPEPVTETYKVTAYCICETCCGKTDGIGAAGNKVEPGVAVAAGQELPLGTELYIDGIGHRTVQDRGSAIGGHELDLLVETHEAALVFGVQYLEVIVK